MITSDKQISPSNLTFKQNSLHFFFALFILCMDIISTLKDMEIHLCKTLLLYTILKWGLVVQFAYWPRGGGWGHLGIFWVGMCRLELQIGTPF